MDIHLCPLRGDARHLYYLDLRSVLTDLIARSNGRVWTVAELADALVVAGFTLCGRPSKVISDALRTEVARGRVLRVGRGRYVAGTIPDTTRRRIAGRARRRRDGLRSAA